jgi:hypothetical protein
MRSANNIGNAGPHVRQTFLNDVFTFLTELGNTGKQKQTNQNKQTIKQNKITKKTCIFFKHELFLKAFIQGFI